MRSPSFFKRVGSVFTLYDMILNKGAVMSRLVSPFVDFFIVRYSGQALQKILLWKKVNYSRHVAVNLFSS